MCLSMYGSVPLSLLHADLLYHIEKSEFYVLEGNTNNKSNYTVTQRHNLFCSLGNSFRIFDNV